jgi:glutamine amidotransferase
LEAGVDAVAALADVVRRAAEDGEVRATLLLTDGRRIVATRWGPSLVWRAGPTGVVVASEPHDDDPGWTDVPDRRLVVADADGVHTAPL